MPKVSEAHKEQVRRHLLDAAWRVIERDGVDATTTRAILDEADMSAGALYSYFSSKGELLRVLTEEKVNESLTLVAAEGRPDEGESGLLVRFAEDLLTRPERSPSLTLFRARMTGDAETDDVVRDINRSMVERFAPLVSAAQRSGGFDPSHDPEALVELVDLVVDGLNRRHVSGTFATSFERVGQLAVALFLGALQPEDPPSEQQEQDT